LPGRHVRRTLRCGVALAPDLLVANGAARAGEQIEIVLTAEQRKTIEAAAA
jgi:hypothetical protein